MCPPLPANRNLLGIASTLARTPWLQFNPVSLMNSNKGVFGVRLGRMWNESIGYGAGPIRFSVSPQKACLSLESQAFLFDEAADAHGYIHDAEISEKFF
jgi:hypothetical protein